MRTPAVVKASGKSKKDAHQEHGSKGQGTLQEGVSCVRELFDWGREQQCNEPLGIAECRGHILQFGGGLTMTF